MQDERMTYEDFEQDWLKRHKRSLPVKPRISSWALIGGILIWSIIAVGAALVSGAHSVPAIHQTIPSSVPDGLRSVLSLSGFTIFELLIFAGALYRRDSHFAKWGLLLSMIGALAANIGSSVFAVTENGGDWLNMTVGVVLAFIAPLAAFLAGEMVHRLYEQHKEKIGDAFAKYDAARENVDKLINRDYKAYTRDFAKQHAAQETSRNPFMNDGEMPDLHEISRNDFTKSGEKKPRVKIHEIARQVHENGDVDLSTAEMMAKYNISLGSTSKIREILKGGNSQFLQ